MNQPVSTPIVLSNQPPLVLDGKTPAALWFGAEYCPFCAAERWALTAALSRFGSFGGLKSTASSYTDISPNTKTFTYRSAKFVSPYIAFVSIEEYSNVRLSSGSYATLQTPTHEEQTVIDDDQSFLPDATAGVSFPFVNIGNVILISGSSFSPQVLSGLTQDEIAGGLRDATNPATAAIVATANYISAAICTGTKQRPSSVCGSNGVQAADRALHLG